MSYSTGYNDALIAAAAEIRRQGKQVRWLSSILPIIADSILKLPVPIDFDPNEIRPDGPLADIAAERRRQIEVEDFTASHDDENKAGNMALAGAAYAMHAARFFDAEQHGVPYRIKAPPPEWPWDRVWWKPKSPRRDLIVAAALIVAEIDRLDRWTA